MSFHYKTPKTLAGKNALVTGSSRGIGAAIAIRLAQHGANVAVNYVASSAAAEEVADQIRDLGVKAITVQADVSRKEDVQHMFEKVVAEFKHLDIVHSNSGIEHFNTIADITEAEIDKTFATNVKGQFFVAQQAYSYLPESGRLILTSSISAVQGFANHAIYSASKAAILGMAKSLAHDFGPKKVTVNVIAPGGIKTDMYEEAAREYFPNGHSMTNEEVEEAVAKFSPLYRAGYPDDIAGAVSLIASPESQWMTGQTFYVGGGAYMN